MALFQRIVYSNLSSSVIESPYMAAKQATHNVHNERLIRSLCASYPALQGKHKLICNRLNASIKKGRTIFGWQLNEIDLDGKDNQENRDKLATFFQLLITTSFEDESVEQFIITHSDTDFYRVLACPRNDNSVYYAFLYGLIYSIFTEDITAENNMDQALQKPDGFLDSVLKHLNLRGISDVTKEDKRNLKSFFEKCLLAYPVQSSNLSEINLSAFLADIAVPALRNLPCRGDKSIFFEQPPLGRKAINMLDFGVRLRILEAQQVEASKSNHHIISDRPTVYLKYQGGYFDTLISCPYTREEQAWYMWLESKTQCKLEDVSEKQAEEQLDWSFYLKCIANLGFLSGGVLLILGIVYMSPGLLVASGIASIMGYCFFSPVVAYHASPAIQEKPKAVSLHHPN